MMDMGTVAAAWRQALVGSPLARRGVLKAATVGSLAVLTGESIAPRAVTAAPVPTPTGQLRRRESAREYWIQAEAFAHNLVPTGRDAMTGTEYAPEQTSYDALGYRAYTPNWREPLPADPAIGLNEGIPGPTIRAAVGDTIRVHFRNNDTHYNAPHSIHPHGVGYRPDSDGAWTAAAPTKPGTAVGVGETYTYEWVAAPSSVGTWLYHDHSAPLAIGTDPPKMELGAQLGLFGLIVVTDPATPAADREFLLVMHDLYKDDVPQLAEDFDCFNGRAFMGNTPTFRAKVGDRVRWRVAALGQEFHSFHLHGHRWVFNGRFDDALVLGPATTVTFEYVEDNPGEWLYHCHVTDHMMGGMVGTYIVAP